jgi:RNA polymerase sigma-70 factor (ECF subfamily)
MARATVTSRTDEAAFAAFLQQQRPRVHAFLRRLCGRDAEDVLQDTMAKVWRLRTGFDPARNGAAWLLRAAFRTFCDHRTRRGTADPLGADTAAPEVPCATELRDEVRHRLAALAPIERELLLGFHAHGLSLRELAARHRLNTNTVKSHLHRARRRLQERAEPHDDTR